MMFENFIEFYMIGVHFRIGKTLFQFSKIYLPKISKMRVQWWTRFGGSRLLGVSIRTTTCYYITLTFLHFQPNVNS